MTEVPVERAGVGTNREPERAVQDFFLPMSVWPHITPKKWETASAAVLERIGVSLEPNDLKHEAFNTEHRSVVWIPMGVISTEGEASIFNWSECFAEFLGSRQLRYGSRGSNLFLGSDAPLSEAEAQTCRDNALWQYQRGKPVTELLTNEDGSQTLGYNRMRGRSQSIRMPLLHSAVTREIAPHLEGGAVLVNPPITSRSEGYPSLFERVVAE